MRPVNHAALVITCELAEELDSVPFANSADSRRQVDVVRDQQGPAAGQSDDEALVIV